MVLGGMAEASILESSLALSHMYVLFLELAAKLKLRSSLPGAAPSFRPAQKLILTSSQSKALWWTRAISISGRDELYARHRCWEKHHGRHKV